MPIETAPEDENENRRFGTGYIIEFHHVAEVVFLAPSAEYTLDNGGANQGAGGGDGGCLVPQITHFLFLLRCIVSLNDVFF